MFDEKHPAVRDLDKHVTMYGCSMSMLGEGYNIDEKKIAQ